MTALVDVHEGSEDELFWSVREGVLECVLNRTGALNALTPNLLNTLAQVVSDGVANPEVRLVSVVGAGSKSFSSGFDLKVLRALGADAHKGAPLETATGVLRDCPKPTIAVVDGYCLGAGMDLAMSCDFRFATPQSRFGVPAIKIGTVYRPRAIERFVDVLGPTVTKQLFALGRQFEADQALLAGIVQLVAERDELTNAVTDWADYMPESATAVQAHKHIVDAFSKTTARDPEFWEPLDALRQQSVNSDERRAAVEAFSTTRREGS